MYNKLRMSFHQMHTITMQLTRTLGCHVTMFDNLADFDNQGNEIEE